MIASRIGLPVNKTRGPASILRRCVAMAGQEDNVFKLACGTSELCGTSGSVRRADVVANSDYVGEGYGFSTGPDPTPELIRVAANLERAGASVLAIPCNTAHVCANSIRSAVSIPLLDMVKLTTARIAASGRVTRVGLLASTAVHKTALYANAFSAHGIMTALPTRQDEVMALIEGVKRGDSGAPAKALIGEIAQDMAARSDLLLVACSELSVIANGITAGFEDSMDVRAQAIVEFATK